MYPGFMPAPPMDLEDLVGQAGEPIDVTKVKLADESLVIEALKTVYDPEIPVNIFDLGLIYGFNIAENGSLDIEMTLTAPGCPVAGELVKEVADTTAALEGIGEVEVRLVWEPAWTMDRMSEEARLVLDMF